MADNHTGKITQIIGAVLDIKFSDGHLPEINDAIDIMTKQGGKLVVEVSQHLGDDTVRCIAMGPTDGLVRGMEAVCTGGPISVPVGEQTLGRMFNVLGDPIDNKPAPEGRRPFMPVPERRKDWTVRRCRRRKDGPDSGTDPKHCHRARRIFRFHRSRRTNQRGK